MKFGYIDGLRGLAAATVLVSHCVEQTGTHPVLSGFLGRIAVAAFITLSGYCLSLPVSRTEGKTLEGGLAGFAVRRVRRILPPYYAALLLSVLLLFAIPRFGTVTGVPVTHLLLLHNWYLPWEPRWEYAINPALWTVATEWQIYFVFALALIPIWRRFGTVKTVLAAGAGSILFQAAWMSVQPDTAINGPCPWFLGLFGMGMGAASLRPGSLRAKRIPWTLVLFGSVAGAILLWRSGHSMKIWEIVLADWLLGAATASFLIWASIREENASPILRFLGSRGMRALGGFSYSLYVTHIPVLWTICYWAACSGAARTDLPVLLTLGVPAALAFAFVFHLVFERPFTARRSSRRANGAAQARHGRMPLVTYGLGNDFGGKKRPEKRRNYDLPRARSPRNAAMRPVFPSRR